MATAKTPKSAPAKAVASKPAAAVKAAAPKPVAAKPVAPKPVAAAQPAAIAKPAEAAVVKPVEIVAEAVEAAVAPVEIAPAPAVVAVVKKAEEKRLDGVETLLEFGRDNAILLVSAGNDFALGVHKLSLSLIDWSAESCDKSVAGAAALLSAKTVEEVIDLSQSLAQDGIQHLLKEGSELGSLSSKLLEETFVPLPGRLVAAVEKLASHAA